MYPTWLEIKWFFLHLEVTPQVPQQESHKYLNDDHVFRRRLCSYMYMENIFLLKRLFKNKTWTEPFKPTHKGRISISCLIPFHMFGHLDCWCEEKNISPTNPGDKKVVTLFHTSRSRRAEPSASPNLPTSYVGLSLGPQDPRRPPASYGTHGVNCRYMISTIYIRQQFVLNSWKSIIFS